MFDDIFLLNLIKMTKQAIDDDLFTLLFGSNK